MDSNDQSLNENIREIEDIIDIQKANGSFNIRQVAFNIPSKTDGTIVSANLAKSLESGLTKSKCDDGGSKIIKKIRYKRGKSPSPDVISWPSDSDITVLRMRLCLNDSDLKEKVDNAIRGDGLHQPDSSSMFNLATLIRQSRPTSKHDLNDEYLLPLTSWEGRQEQSENKTVVNNQKSHGNLVQLNRNFNVYDAICSRLDELSSIYSNSNDASRKPNRKSKLARFLRLYFCPCCMCLYKIEKMSDQPSVYITRNNT